MRYHQPIISCLPSGGTTLLRTSIGRRLSGQLKNSSEFGDIVAQVGKSCRNSYLHRLYIIVKMNSYSAVLIRCWTLCASE